MPRYKQHQGDEYMGPVWDHPIPPIWHGDGTVTLYHDDSPGVRLRVKATLWRRLVLRNYPFTTIGDRRRYYKAHGIKRKKRWL